MTLFEGFPPGKMNTVKLPEQFFSECLALVEDVNELKLLLFFFWAFNQQENPVKYFQKEELFESVVLRELIGQQNFEEKLTTALEQAQLSQLVLIGSPRDNQKIILYFLNSARSRAVIEALQNGSWQPQETDHLPPDATQSQSQKTIYQLFEENIGPLTPLLSEDLKAAEAEYSAQWIQEAIHLAVQGNVRKWNYIEAILKSWKKEGKNANTRRDHPENGGERRKSQFEDFIQH